MSNQNPDATATPNRPDTDELRMMAGLALRLMPKGMDGDAVNDAVREAADWIDAQPAPVPSYPSSDERLARIKYHIEHVIRCCAGRFENPQQDDGYRVVGCLWLPMVLELLSDVEPLTPKLPKFLADLPGAADLPPDQTPAEAWRYAFAREKARNAAAPSTPVPAEPGHVSPIGWHHDGPASECPERHCRESRAAAPPVSAPAPMDECARPTARTWDSSSHCHHWLNEEQPCHWCGFNGDDDTTCPARPAPSPTAEPTYQKD